MTPHRLTYVMGYGRSGSTIVGIILGDHPSVVNVGELGELVTSREVSDGYCSCGARSAACPFWSRVWARWRDLRGECLSDEGYAELQRAFEGRGSRAHISAVLSGGRLSRDRMWRVYCAGTGALLEAILETAEGAVIVDSSKSPLRALALSKLPNVELSVIHLVRDVRGVAWSLNRDFKPDPKAGVVGKIKSQLPELSAIKWAGINLVSGTVRKRLGERALIVRYEDFVSHPKAELCRISRLTGVDFALCAEKLVRGEPFRAEHAIAGNRLRMRRRITLEPDMNWTEEMSATRKRLLPSMTFPIYRVYYD